MITKTVEHEPGPFETLYFSPSWLPDTAWSQSFLLGSTEKDVLSMVMLKTQKKYDSEYCQMWFDRKEVDLIIERLNEMKNRWDNWEKFKEELGKEDE
jgi:hypothetical protein